jgi:glycerophosphoryl diester phosphodiesterase
MNRELFNKSFPIICFHRGYSKKAPENTVSAIKAALNVNAKMIEIDIQLSKDDALVVIHDFKINRLSEGKGAVSKIDLAELKKYDFGSKFSPEFAGEKIPTLKEVLDICGDKILINLELKWKVFGKNKIHFIEKVINTLKEYNLNNSILITSFNWSLIKQLRQYYPMMITGLIFDKRISKYSALRFSNKNNIPFLVSNYKIINNNFIKKVHDIDKSIFVYTVNDPDDIKRLKSIGADGIITDGVEENSNNSHTNAIEH